MASTWRTLLTSGLLIGSLGVLTVATAQATTVDNALGLSYVTGVHDVGDFYDDEEFLDVTTWPVGLAYRLTVNLDVGVRFDFGVGPVVLMFGDADYWDVPLQATVGYSLFPHHTFRPYIRGGASYHFMDGDLVDSKAGAGLLGAVGVEIGKRGRVSFFGEVSLDTAEATFRHDNPAPGGSSSEDIKVSDVAVTLGVTF